MRQFAVYTFLICAMFYVGPALADFATGCVTPGGVLKNLAQGDEPSKPCGPKDTLVQLMRKKDSTCPCDIPAAARFAGWVNPTCDVSLENGVRVRDGSGTNSLGPGVFVKDEGNDWFCQVGTLNGYYSHENLSDTEREDCLEDADDLIATLGLRIDGADGSDDCNYED